MLHSILSLKVRLKQLEHSLSQWDIGLSFLRVIVSFLSHFSIAQEISLCYLQGELRDDEVESVNDFFYSFEKMAFSRNSIV